MIGNLPTYLHYWKRKFRDSEVIFPHKLHTSIGTALSYMSPQVAAYCTTMRARVGEEGEEQEFSFLSDIVPEDKELRRRLQEERLEQVNTS